MIRPEMRRAMVRALVAAEPTSAQAVTPGTVGRLERLCRAAVRALPATGAVISVMTLDGVRGVAAASDPDCAALEEVEFMLGEGPCIEAFALRRPVLEPDVDSASTYRWPGYREAAQRVGVRAVFAFPLQVGAAGLGVLDVHRHSPGGLLPDALLQALTFAEVGVETLLDGQEHALPGTAETPLDQALDQALDSQFTVYQAQGMAMVDLGVTLADAMARLQAHAYAHDRPLQDVAGDIVSGRLRLEPDPS